MTVVHYMRIVLRTGNNWHLVAVGKTHAFCGTRVRKDSATPDDLNWAHNNLCHQCSVNYKKSTGEEPMSTKTNKTKEKTKPKPKPKPRPKPKPKVEVREDRNLEARPEREPHLVALYDERTQPAYSVDTTRAFELWEKLIKPLAKDMVLASPPAERRMEMALIEEFDRWVKRFEGFP